MSAYLLDPILVMCAAALVLALWAWWPYVEALGELSGLLAEDVTDRADLPMWAVVVGGWSLVVCVAYVVWLGATW